MRVAEFLADLARQGITLRAEGEQIHYYAAKGALTPALRKELSACKAEILTFLRSGDTKAIPLPPTLLSTKRGSAIPLSFAQERLWFFAQLEPESHAYVEQMALQLTGSLDVVALKRSLNEIVQRHEMLRTTFASAEDNPVQVISPALHLLLPSIDLTRLDKDRRKAEIQRLLTALGHFPFDLSRGPLIQSFLLHQAPQEHVLIIVLHHILTDVWSTRIFLRELATLYKAYSQGHPALLPELPIQYADYAIWQRQWLQAAALEPLLAYWREQLAGIPALLELPTDYPRPSQLTYHGARYFFQLPAALSQQLQTLNQQEGVTLFMTLLASLQVLLWRYSGQENIVVGTQVAGRTRREFEKLIGLFTNTLPLRTNLAGNPPFRTLLKRVRNTCLDAYEHQDLPFGKLVEALHPERSLSYTPIFQVMLILQTLAVLEPFSLHGLEHELIEQEGSDIAKCDLLFDLRETPEGLAGYVEYSSDLFEAATIQRMLERLHRVLDAIVKDPSQHIAEISLLTEAEQCRVFSSENTLESAVAREVDIIRLFAAQVVRTPDTVAVVFEDQHLTYRDLWWRAGYLAAFLQRQGIGPGVAVGLCLERSLEAIVGLLAILHAGGIYIPLDPTLAGDRLSFILKETRMPLLLTQEALLPRLKALPVKQVCLDVNWPAIAAAPPFPQPPSLQEKQLAYVIYTSGSTGQPKGVAIERGSLTCFAQAAAQLFEIEAGDRVLQFASLSFDASFEEIAPCLIRGATLHLRSELMLSDSAYFLQTCSRWGLSVLDLPTAYWHELVMSLSREEAALPDTLRLVIIGGEKAQAEGIAKWQHHARGRVRLVNTYGPTEATVVATMHWVEGDRPGEAAVIGEALPYVQAYVLDRQMQPVPAGLPGELYLGGAGIAQGYLNRPDLTAQSFVPHPFSSTPGARLYQTGDQARFLPDGALEFRGRADSQVKIRGYRIELGEVEAALSLHQSVRAAFVSLYEPTPGSKFLVAYVVADQARPCTSDELRRYLQQSLPYYMLPSLFIWLETLPLLTNGKVDRRALPQPQQAQFQQEKSYEAPRSPTEELLVPIWAQVLQLEKVGVHDNFFELGGHSLLATQIIVRTRKAFQVELPLHTLFLTPTIAGIAEQLEAIRQKKQGLRIPPIKRLPRHFR